MRAKTPSLPLRYRFSTVLLVVLGFLSAGCSPEDAEPRHVFLITVDTLRADHLTPYGYARDTSPNLAELADDGVLFERAMAQWPKTGASFASLFSGLYPQTTGLTHEAAIRLPEEYLSLPELFQRRGFTTVAVVSNGVLGRRLGWHAGFDAYHETWKLAPETSDDPLEYRKWLAAPVVNRLAEPLLTEHRDAERLFAWIHYSDPHAPYYLPEGEENPFLGDDLYRGDERVRLDRPRGTALGERRDLKYYVAQYDANVRLVDRHMGRLLEVADGHGLLDDALVVFTADHGESLGEHGYYFGHGRLPYQPGTHVPLVFHWPQALPKGTRVGDPVELVDLYPTLQELVAPETPVPDLEGDSLVGLLFGDGNGDDGDGASFRFAFSEAGGGSPTTHYRVIQDDRWKLVYHPRLHLGEGEARPPWYELYDLETDPGETRDLSGEEESQLRRLRSELNRWMDGEDWIRMDRRERKAHHEETLKALKALGYIE